MKLGKFAAVTGATVVLVTAGGVGGATAGSLVTSSQIKNNTIHTVDIKDGTIKVADFDQRVKNLLASRKLVKVGGTGGNTTNVTTKLSGYEIVTGQTGAEGTRQNMTVLVTAECPAGKKVVGGGLTRPNDSYFDAGHSGIVASWASSPTTWSVHVSDMGGPTDQVQAQAVCVTGDSDMVE